MAMITTAKVPEPAGSIHQVFECLRCGLVETTTDQRDREQELREQGRGGNGPL